MKKSGWTTALIAIACLGSAPSSPAQTALEGQNLSALSPENLAKARPKPPFDLTGTWNMVIDAKNGQARIRPGAEAHGGGRGGARQVHRLRQEGVGLSR